MVSFRKGPSSASGVMPRSLPQIRGQGADLTQEELLTALAESDDALYLVSWARLQAVTVRHVVCDGPADQCFRAQYVLYS